MLWSATAVNGYTVQAADGPIGVISDFLFDDTHWRVRWLVVDTGRWLSGRKVIVPTHVLGHPNARQRSVAVSLTQQQIEDSPAVGLDQPLSRQTEAHAYDHYGVSPYWGAGYLGGYRAQWGSTPFPVSGDADRNRKMAEAEQDRYDPSLRSFDLVTGYHIEARDGDIGHVQDFLVDDANWSIPFMVIDTHNWWAGKHVLVSPKSVLEIDWQDRMITLNADRQKVKDSPAYEPTTVLDKDLVRQLHHHYELPAEEERPAT